MLKSILVIVILAVMVLILLGIGQLFSQDFSATEDEARSLREDVRRDARNRDNHSSLWEDVRTRRDVITDASAFRTLVKGKRKMKNGHPA